jgi:alpha-L-fucosidase 2
MKSGPRTHRTLIGFCCLSAFLVASVCGRAAAVKPRSRSLVSSQPARRWEEALVTGNGNMGVMVFGRPYAETLVVNHCKLYLPLGNREIVQDFAASMPVFKAAGLKAGRDGPAVVHKMMQARATQKIVPTDPFHPAFLLSLNMGRKGELGAYQRVQDLSKGEVTVRWSDEQGDWQRSLLVSRSDNVVALHIRGPAGKVDCELALDMKHELIEPEIHAADGWLSAHTRYVKGKGGYDSLLRVTTVGGSTQSRDETIRVSGADQVLVLMQVRTWKTPLPPEQSEAWAYSPRHPDFGPGHKTHLLADMKRALGQMPASYEALLTPHARVHSAMFKRVSLDLKAGSARETSSEALLERAANEGEMSPALIERMYDACRYLTICSTGERPANLQGIWTGTWKPAWSGDYTLDSNLQLEVQSLLSCNLPELMHPYFDLVESWLPECRLNARKFYGCGGAMSNARASNTCLLLHWDPWPGEQAISCLGWLAHFFYDYYLFTGDKVFLAERVVPLLQEVVLFYEDLLQGTEDEQGHYRFFISYSPEHRLYANASFDIGVAKAMLSYLIEASKVIDLDPAQVARWLALLAKMPPYLINAAGELQEWAWPGVQEDYNQRHHSHFLPLYQFNEFDPLKTPALWKANARAFEQKVTHWLHNFENSNSNHITHGMANQGQCAARLGRGDIVYEVLTRFATKQYLYPSFMMSYWPGLKGYGFDPIGTLPDIVNNSLIYAWGGTVDLLPALPDAWPQGSVRGIRLRGQIQVEDLTWNRPGGRIELSLNSGADQSLALRLPQAWNFIAVNTSGDAQAVPLNTENNFCHVKLLKDQPTKLSICFTGRP